MNTPIRESCEIHSLSVDLWLQNLGSLDNKSFRFVNFLTFRLIEFFFRFLYR